MLLAPRYRWPLLLAGTAIFLRLAFFLFMPPHPHGDDARQYLQMAQSVAAGLGFAAPLKGESSAVPRYDEPFFIYISALILNASRGSESAIIIFQAILSGTASLLVYGIAKRSSEKNTALLSSAIYSIYPALVLESNLLGQDAWLVIWTLISTYLTIIAAQTGNGWRIIFAGVAWSVTLLTKQLVIFLPIFLIPAIWISTRSARITWKYVAIIILCPLVIITPLLMNNLRSHVRQQELLTEMLEQLPPPYRSTGEYIVSKGRPAVPDDILAATRDAMFRILKRMKDKYPRDAQHIEMLNYSMTMFAPFRSSSLPFIGGTGIREFAPSNLLKIALSGAGRVINEPYSLVETFVIPYGNFYIDFLAGESPRLRDLTWRSWAIGVKLVLVLLHLALLGTAFAGIWTKGTFGKPIVVFVFVYFFVLSFLYPSSINRFLLSALPFGIILSSHFLLFNKYLLLPRPQQRALHI